MAGNVSLISVVAELPALLQSYSALRGYKPATLIFPHFFCEVALARDLSENDEYVNDLDYLVDILRTMSHLPALFFRTIK